jgi:hypothetical protein
LKQVPTSPPSSREPVSVTHHAHASLKRPVITSSHRTPIAFLQPVYTGNEELYSPRDSFTISPATSMRSLRDVRRKSSVRSVESVSGHRIEVTLNRPSREDATSRASRQPNRTGSVKRHDTKNKHQAPRSESRGASGARVERKSSEYESSLSSSDETAERQSESDRRTSIRSSLTPQSRPSIDRNESKGTNRNFANRGRWKCVQCRFVNRSNSDSCEVCCRTNPWRKTPTPVETPIEPRSNQKWHKKRIQSQDSAYYDDDDDYDDEGADDVDDDLDDENERDHVNRTNNRSSDTQPEVTNQAKQCKDRHTSCRKSSRTTYQANCSNDDDHEEESEESANRIKRNSIRSMQGQSIDSRSKSSLGRHRSNVRSAGESKVNQNCATKSNELQTTNGNDRPFCSIDHRSISSPTGSNVGSIEIDLNSTTDPIDRIDQIEPIHLIDKPELAEQFEPTDQGHHRLSPPIVEPSLDSLFDTITATDPPIEPFVLIDLNKEPTIELHPTRYEPQHSSYRQDLNQLDDFAMQLLNPSPVHFQTNQLFQQCTDPKSSEALSSHRQTPADPSLNPESNRQPLNALSISPSKTMSVDLLDKALQAGLDMTQLKIGIKMEPNDPIRKHVLSLSLSSLSLFLLLPPLTRPLLRSRISFALPTSHSQRATCDRSR